VNDEIGYYFQTRKGLRQGDPLSSVLFNLVVDMLAILINRAKEDGQVEGLIPHLVEGGVSVLQYADDTIIFLEHDLEKALNMKLILCIFEQLSGLNINFHKSELFCFGKAKEGSVQTSFWLSIWNAPYQVLPPSQNVRRLIHLIHQIKINRFTRKYSFLKYPFDIVDIHIFSYKLGQT
jgi:hypothetical protein